MSNDAMTYANAGVDIDAANALVRKISPMAARTHVPGVMSSLGGFGGLFDLQAAGQWSPGHEPPLLVSTTDGVGTKLKLAFATNRHTTIGIDCVAMCVNDLLTTGAKPLFFLDYFATGQLETGIAADVISGVARGCELAGCALLGGETAEMPGMYSKGEYDLAGFSVGAVPRDQVLPKTTAIAAGDAIIGVAASGFHSNGFSLLRHIIDTHALDLNTIPEGFEATLGELLLEPTRIYSDVIGNILGWNAEYNALPITAMAHITGGGLIENVPRVLPEGLGANIDTTAWSRSPIYDFMLNTGGVALNEAWRVFNMGVGLTVVVAKAQADETVERVRNAGCEAWRIGEVVTHDSDADRVVMR